MWEGATSRRHHDDDRTTDQKLCRNNSNTRLLQVGIFENVPHKPLQQIWHTFKLIFMARRFSLIVLSAHKNWIFIDLKIETTFNYTYVYFVYCARLIKCYKIFSLYVYSVIDAICVLDNNYAGCAHSIARCVRLLLLSHKATKLLNLNFWKIKYIGINCVCVYRQIHHY